MCSHEAHQFAAPDDTRGPPEVCEPALRLEIAPERRYSLEPNERKFLSLGANFTPFSNVPFRVKRIR